MLHIKAEPLKFKTGPHTQRMNTCIIHSKIMAALET